MVWRLTIRNRDTTSLLNLVRNRGVRMTFVLLTMLSTGKVCNSQDTPPRSNPDIEILKKNDVRMGPPGSGDWLSIHDEKGQTFKQYVEGSPVRAGRYQSKIYLQPIGEFSPIQTKVIAYTAEYLRIFFDRSTVVLKALPDSVIPESGRRNHQLHAGTILDLLEKSLPADGIVIMAITSRDLFPNRRWNFVFGQARPSNRVGVSSLYRYSPLRMDSSNYQICLERLIKTSSHEIGHMFSCQHCINAVCLMNGANNLAEADSRSNRLCSECLQKLQWNLGFEVTPRLRKMRDFFKRHKLTSDYNVTVRDLKTLSATKSLD